MSQLELVDWLREHGYGLSSGNAIGWYEIHPNALGIFPNPAANPNQEPALIDFSSSQVTRIAMADGTQRPAYEFAPQLITNLSDRDRAKRRLVQFSEIPSALVDAVVSTEDKHFFSHSGFDLLRVMKAAYVDLKQRRKEQGASTLTMQLSRGIWLGRDKRWGRKFAELLLTMHLEHKLTKQQIFTYYANEVYLGRRGTFSINGFGEAAHVYFDKDISQLTVPEAAVLAGLVQRPSYYNPFRYPDRALDRRNLVLHLMRENHRLSDAQYAQFAAAPLGIAAGGMEGVDSQYFLDLANEEVQDRLGDREPGRESVYTTLDEDLQRAAVDAVRIGMENVDAQLRRRKQDAPVPAGQPQVALIALDPHTGEIRALVGGRDYGASQLNHVTAERQPGSSFKPFVYAAALNTALTGGQQVFTPATTLEDEPSTFHFGNQEYRPGNFGGDFLGTVSLREALAHSLNVATVSLAQEVGYKAVVSMARRAGLNNGIQPTPAVALGAYVCTPLEIAGAYTVFANGGVYVKPSMVTTVKSQNGRVLYRDRPESHPALDPRVNYLMVNMLEEVLRSGTGAGVWARGFRGIAAGKTGTSRDGWFAGFTTQLLSIVWVGFDDYRDLGLEGAKSALPIWAEFMKRAAQYSRYRNAKDFPIPTGVVSARLCSESRQLATERCPSTYTEYFVAGSELTVECELHSGDSANADRSEETDAGPR
ncbi:MAG TPA: PBP1A family penicillin-binding protein [Bryobacteraceae bacterium]|nr:PBP1A family penicillin-binding protein [Bryobacteraceae bacterium]